MSATIELMHVPTGARRRPNHLLARQLPMMIADVPVLLSTV
jgi:hypothetical protein